MPLSKGVESYHPGILDKTIMAILHMWAPQYQFLVRSNVSTIVNWQVLLPLLAAHARQLQLGGGKIIKSFRLHQFGKTFVQGTAMIMAAQVVNELVACVETVNRKFMDDVALTQVVKGKVKQLHDFGNYYKVTSKDYTPNAADAARYAFFRNKTHASRGHDVQRMRAITQQLIQALSATQAPSQTLLQ